MEYYKAFMLKKVIFTFLITGSVFAGLMSLFEYHEEGTFSMIEFILWFIGSGLALSLINYRSIRRNDKSAKDNNIP